VPECPVNPPSTNPPQRPENHFNGTWTAHMEKQNGKTLQEAARPMATAKLQFRWLDAPRSSPVAAGTKADALKHGGMGGNEVLQQVLQRAILAEQKASALEASLKDMTAQRDKWVRRNTRFLRQLATRLERCVESDCRGEVDGDRKPAS
jgi:hypothetical protein